MLFRRLGTVFVVLVLVAATAAAPALAQTDTPAEANWYARYWNETDLDGEPDFERSEEILNHRWGFGSPADEIDAETFSARWTTQPFFEAGTYRFITQSDDGIRVWVDSTRIIDNWTVHAEETNTAVVELAEGQHNIVVEYFEQTGAATATLSWELANQTAPGNETVSISPNSGAPGTVVAVSATGFPASADVTVGAGVINAEPSVSKTVMSDELGRVNTTIKIPDTADTDETWVVLVSSGLESALSSAFDVTSGLAPTGVTVTTRVNLNMRTGPGVEFQWLDTVPAGTTLSVIGRNEISSWVLVEFEGARGWMAAWYTDVGGSLLDVPVTDESGGEIGEEEPADPAGEDTGVTATTTVNLRMRSGPSTAYEQIGLAMAGTTVNVIGRNDLANWILVDQDGFEAWVAAWYTNINGDLTSVPVTAP